MANMIVRETSVNTIGTLTVEQNAAAIRQRTHDMLQSASLAQVQTRMPEYVPVVEELMSKIDWQDHLTIARVGAWAMQDQLVAGLDLLEAVQKGPSREALLAVDAFDAALQKRMRPLQERMEQRRKQMKIDQSKWSKLVDAIMIRLSDKEKRRDAESKRLREEMAGYEEENMAFVEVINKTIGDVQHVHNLIVLNRDVPDIIAKQIQQALYAYGETEQKLYLSLVSLNEFGQNLSEVVLPELQRKASQPDAQQQDYHQIEQAQKALIIAETQRSMLISAFANTCLQYGMTAELAVINAGNAVQLGQLEGLALPQMVGNLGILAAQQRAGESIATINAATRLLGDSTKAAADGFVKILDMAKQADEANLQAAKTVVTSVQVVLGSVDDFRQHQAQHILRQREVQAELTGAVADLRIAATKFSGVPALAVASYKQLSAPADAAQPVVEVMEATPPQQKPQQASQFGKTTQDPWSGATRPAKNGDAATALFNAAKKNGPQK